MRFIILFLMVVSFSFQAGAAKIEVQDVIKACQESGGEWKTFFDGCADTCYAVRVDAPKCTRVIKKSCECGVSKCWDSGTIACVDN